MLPISSRATGQQSDLSAKVQTTLCWVNHNLRDRFESGLRDPVRNQTSVFKWFLCLWMNLRLKKTNGFQLTGHIWFNQSLSSLEIKSFLSFMGFDSLYRSMCCCKRFAGVKAHYYSFILIAARCQRVTTYLKVQKLKTWPNILVNVP